jgi:hypothetical protein
LVVLFLHAKVGSEGLGAQIRPACGVGGFVEIGFTSRRVAQDCSAAVSYSCTVIAEERTDDAPMMLLVDSSAANIVLL